MTSEEPEKVVSSFRESDKMPPDSPWRQRIREQVGTTAKQYAEAAARLPEREKELKSNFPKWTNSDPYSRPSISSLLQVARIIDYPLVEQLLDLGYVERRDLELVDSPLMIPGWRLMQRLEQALHESRRMASGTAELVLALRSHTLRTSGDEPGDLARWRARVFDVPVGSRYPHIGYHAVEFETWLGPNFNGPPETRLAERVKLGSGALRRLVPSPMEQRRLLKKHINHRRHTPAVLAGAYERAELERRLQSSRADGHFNVYGLEGTLGQALVDDKSSGARHIYVEAASSRTDGAVTRPQTPAPELFGTDRTTAKKVLLIAPPAASTVALAHLVGRALGWNVLSLRQTASSAKGSVVRIRDQVGEAMSSVDRAARAFRTGRGVEDHTILAATYLPYLVTSLEGRELLMDDSVLPVLLRPTRLTLDAWSARQRIGQNIRKPKTADETLEVLDQVEQVLQHRSEKRILQFDSDMKWWPSSPLTPGSYADQPDYFEDPVVGDIRLQAAYQLAYLFLRGSLPNAKAVKIYFHQGPVARFHDRLLGDVKSDKAYRPLCGK